MKVVYLGPPFALDDVERSLKKALSPVIVSDQKMLVDEIKMAFGIIDASMKFKLDRAILETATKLRVISCATTGADHIDSSYLSSKGISLHTLKEDPEVIYNLTPAAELSWTLLMACARKLPQALEHVKKGLWNREDFPSVTLKGKQLGLVGFGRIGSWMARYATAFGMNVIAYDPYIKEMPKGIRFMSLLEVLKTSDFISVHVPLNNETINLLSDELMGQIKPGAIIVNTSRGGIINEKALLRCLETGKVAAAGLDVLQGEPLIEGHPLLQYARKHANLLITPHCGGFSPDAVKIVCARAAEKINKYI
jgi:D-3-phosphoglycerate dehydrogenase